MISATLNALVLPRIERNFIQTPIDQITDIVTLDNSMYSDFAGDRYNSWTFNYANLTEDEYNTIKAIYDEQFTLFQYPTLTIAYYSVSAVPVRMSINPKSIIDNCGTVESVQLIFRETAQLPEVS